MEIKNRIKLIDSNLLPLQNKIDYMGAFRFILFLIFNVVFSISLNAQILNGKIVDTKQNPIPYVNIVLLAHDSTFISGTSTDTNGCFLLLLADKASMVKITYLGFKERIINLKPGVNDLGIIELVEDSYMLDGVVINGTVNPTIMKGSNLSFNISESALSNELDIMDILRKMPGLTVKDGSLMSLSGGMPIIYIDGRKIMTTSELKNLEIKNIKTIELDSNPGAEYDASTDMVVSITTKRRLKGLAIELNGDAQKNHRFSHGEGIKMNYNCNKINLFTTFGYDDAQKRSVQDINAIINAQDSIWEHTTNLYDAYSSNKIYNYSLGVNYKINDKHSLGILYNGFLGSMKSCSPQSTITQVNSKPFSLIAGKSELANKNSNNHLNAYYSGKLTDKYQIDVYADYMHTYLMRGQQTTEYYNDDNNFSSTKNNNVANYTLYAVTPKLQYAINNNHILGFGFEYSHVEGESKLSYESNQMKGSDSSTQEDNYASYLFYNYIYNNFTLKASIRYERVNSVFLDYINKTHNIKRNYDNLFPNLTLSYKFKKLNQSISYRSGISRPAFGKLNNYSYYLNKFQYQEGNPELQPQISHNLQYNVMYDFLYLSFRYKYNKDYIGNYFYSNPSNPSVFISTWKNFDKQQQFQIILNAQHHWKIYEPSLTAMFMKNILVVPLLEEQSAIDDPLWYVNFNNYFRLPKNVLLNLEYEYTSKGAVQFFVFKPKHTFNFKIQKSFMDDKFSIDLSIQDIFGKNIDRYTGSIGNITFSQIENQDKRRISIGFVWKFNNYKNTYRGKNAAQDIIDRL